MKLSKIMTTDVACIPPEASAQQAAETMQLRDVGALPVCDQDKKLIGIVTDRDIVVRGIAASASNIALPVELIMTRNVVTAEPDMDVYDAADLMAEERIRRLPVIDGGKLVGMVSLGDFAANHKLDDTAGEVLHDVCNEINLMD